MISPESNETDLWLSLLTSFVHKFNFTARSNDCTISKNCKLVCSMLQSVYIRRIYSAYIRRIYSAIAQKLKFAWSIQITWKRKVVGKHKHLLVTQYQW